MRRPWISGCTVFAVPALLLALTAWPAAAATCEPTRAGVDAVTLAPSGTSAPVGAQHTITATVTARTAGGAGPVQGVCVSFEQSSGPSSGWPRIATTAADGTASVTYTSAAAGTDVLFAQAYGEQTVTSDNVTHRWTAAPSPAVTPTKPPLSPAPSPAGSPAGSPAQPPLPTTQPTTAPSSPATAASPPTSSATPVPQASATSPAPQPSSSATGGFTATLDAPSALPGGSARVTGRGCPAGAGVQLSIGGQSVGTATGDATGAFAADLQLPALAIGPHAVDVSCGSERTSLAIDLVVSTSGPPVASRTATAGAILLFFLLLTTMLLSRDQGTPVPLAGADEDEDEDDDA